MNRLSGWLFVACFVVSGSCVAGTACPDLFTGGAEPAIDKSLTARTTEVCHTEYVLLASGVTKGPIYSAEHLTARQIAGAESIGRTGTWHAETGIPTADRSQSSDYTNSGYDRGHMSPAGDASTLSNEKETFSMANVVPQFHSLNAGQWERIENYVRSVATDQGEVYVVTGPAFEPGSTATIGADQVAVPDYTWKAIYEPGVGAGAYLCTNLQQYACTVVSVSDITAMSGVDPFPSLSASLKSHSISLPLP